MAPSHYFSSPQGSFEPRALQVELAERRLSLSTAGGIFSPDGVDKGTQVLLRGAPDPAQQGNLLDVGCGWGPIALTMAMLSPRPPCGQWTSTSAPAPCARRTPRLRG